MKRRVLLALTLIALTLHLTGCSSSESTSEQTESAAESDLDSVEAEGGDAVAEEGTDNVAPEGDILADLGEDTPAEGEGLQSDEAIEAPLPDQPVSGSSDTLAEAPTDAPAALSSEPAPVESSASSSSGSEDLFGGSAASTEPAAEEAPRPMASLKKVKDRPFTQGGVLANAVYVARDGDTMDTVSAKTGASKKDLKKVNSFLSRGVKVGDKIYYNSAKRATDDQNMMNYFDDMGIPPQTYTAKAGDNLKNVAQELLGNKESWKELWSTNMDLESKGDLSEGTQVRYWALNSDAGAQPSNMMAEATPPPVEPAMPDAGALPDTAALGSVEPPMPPPSEPPPPPPPVEQAKPPKLAKKPETGAFTLGGLDQDMTFAVLGGGILVLGLGVVALLKRQKSKRLSSQTQTQI